MLDRMTAHVDYVTDPESNTDPVGFVMEAFAQPGTLPLLGAGVLVLLALILAWARWRPMEVARVRFIDRAKGYSEYLPWMLRLSVGLVLIGAGLSRVRFMPTIDSGGLFGLLLTGTGFLLLLGLAVRPAALVALGGYLVTLLAHPELVTMLDVAGGLAVAAILGPGRPSLDDLLRAAFPGGPGTRAATQNLASGRYDDLIPLLVRLGLGGAFIASGIVDKLVLYEQALAAVDQYGLTAAVPVSPEMWVVGAAMIETALGAAIVLGILSRLMGAVAFAVLTLALFALPNDPVVAHVGLFGLCSVLVVLGGGRWSLDRAWLAGLGERFRQAP